STASAGGCAWSASRMAGPAGSHFSRAYVGFVVYASTAFGWVFVMKHLKLSTVGVVYSVSMIVLLMALGWIWFGESLGPREVAGLILAIASLYLLMRFA